MNNMEIKIFVWIVISYGLMTIMVYGNIFEWLRNFILRWSESNIFSTIGKFLNGIITCPLCFSTWGGFFLSVALFSPVNELFGIPRELSWFFDGIFSAGAVWAINSIVEFFEENRLN